MRTRSSTKLYSELNSDFESKIIETEYKEIPALLTVDIDFDGASEAWKANKKSIGNSSYKYICQAKTVSGNCCKRESIRGNHFCKIHSTFKKSGAKIQSNLEKKEENPKKLCRGCHPYFQENQLGHIGKYGCLGDEL